MSSPLNTLRKTAAFAALILFGASGPTVASSDATGTTALDNYTWSAQLVALDDASRIATVRAMLVGHDLGDLSGYKDGDRIVLTWSGVTSASGIRCIARGETARGRFEMPVELAAVDGRYLEFRVPIPADHLDRIRTIEPGQWVTAMSPQPATDPARVVVSIRGFNDVG